MTLRRYASAIAASLETLRAVDAVGADAAHRVVGPGVSRCRRFSSSAVTAAADYAIILRNEEQYVGGCGMMPRVGPAAVEVGYWVHAAYLRRGIASEAARLLTNAALAIPGITSVEIHCDEANIPSQNVARSLGFRLDRIEPDKAETPGEIGRSMIWVCASARLTAPGRRSVDLDTGEVGRFRVLRIHLGERLDEQTAHRPVAEPLVIRGDDVPGRSLRRGALNASEYAAWYSFQRARSSRSPRWNFQRFCGSLRRSSKRRRCSSLEMSRQHLMSARAALGEQGLRTRRCRRIAASTPLWARACAPASRGHPRTAIG